MVTVKDIFVVGIMGQSLSQRALSKAYYVSHSVIDVIMYAINIIGVSLYLPICVQLERYGCYLFIAHNIHYV